MTDTLEKRITTLEAVDARNAQADKPIRLTTEARTHAMGALLAEYESRCGADDYPPANPEPGSLAYRAQRLMALLELARDRRDGALGVPDGDA